MHVNSHPSAKITSMQYSTNEIQNSRKHIECTVFVFSKQSFLFWIVAFILFVAGAFEANELKSHEDGKENP